MVDENFMISWKENREIREIREIKRHFDLKKKILAKCCEML